MRYLDFLASHRRLLAFGFLLAFASSFGQTFFIALFGAELRAELELSHGELGAVYSAATLASGLLLMWAGSALDRFDLRAVTAVVCVGLIAAAAGPVRAPRGLRRPRDRSRPPRRQAASSTPQSLILRGGQRVHVPSTRPRRGTSRPEAGR
jgi:MFS family permease